MRKRVAGLALVMTSLTGFSSVSRAETLYGKLAELFGGASAPRGEDIAAEEIWAGKCIHKGSPDTFVGGAIYFHVARDPVLGTVFRAIPFFRYYVASLGYSFQHYIYVKYAAENHYLARSTDALTIDFYQMLRNPNIDHSPVRATPYEWVTTTKVNLRSQFGVSGTFASYLRETRSATGTPLFLLRHDLVEETEAYAYTKMLGPVQYCYFLVDKGVGRMPSEEELVPESGEMPPLPGSGSHRIP